jgi:hypothetical protein
MSEKSFKKMASNDATANGGDEENKDDKAGGEEKKTSKKSKKTSGKSSKFQGDIFSEGSMENAYLLCHNIQV